MSTVATVSAGTGAKFVYGSPPCLQLPQLLLTSHGLGMVGAMMVEDEVDLRQDHQMRILGKTLAVTHGPALPVVLGPTTRSARPRGNNPGRMQVVSRRGAIGSPLRLVAPAPRRAHLGYDQPDHRARALDFAPPVLVFRRWSMQEVKTDLSLLLAPLPYRAVLGLSLAQQNWISK